MKAALPWVLLLGGACAEAPSRVPVAVAQGFFPAPQAVSSVEVAPDGRTLTVTTLAFRQDPNVWVISADGRILLRRNVAPWAPFQGITLDPQKATAVGLAYSRVTSPYPTVSLFGGEGGEETVLEDSLGEWGWLRYGSGDWKTGWTACLLGDLLVRAGDSVFTVRGHNGALRLKADGQSEKYPLKDGRPWRWVSTADSRYLVAGYLQPDLRAASPEIRPVLRVPPALVTVSEASSALERWTFTPAQPAARVPPLPLPGLDFPELGRQFKMEPDALVPFRVALSVAPDAGGTRVALAEYGGWLWVRRTPAIGAWNPPYHVIPFVPRQTGWMRIVSASGEERALEFPRPGLFEVVMDRSGKKVFAVPMSWFARGMAGAAWLPADSESRTVYFLEKDGWKPAWEFPDAVADFALHPDGARAIVSTWDGRLRIVGDRELALDVGSPARVGWSGDGSLGVAGTARGEVVGLDPSGALRFRLELPSADPPPASAPTAPVVEGIPIYSVGRTGKEHAYVGDTWLVKTPGGAFLVDAGGSSSLPFTLARIRAAGVEPSTLSHLLHTHSHGDHAGAAYLWRSKGLKIVAPQSASFALSWLMPMLTDYGVWVPRPVDVPLPLKTVGDEVEAVFAGLRIRAVFVPGHSMDSVIYLLELGGKRVAFTGDLGFQAPSDILHRCWTDVENARRVVAVVKSKVLPFHPDVVFTGHGVRPEGMAFLEDLVKRSEESIQKAQAK